MKVEKYMSHTPVTIQDNTVYAKAFSIMNDKDLHHLPVVNEKNEIVGILTRRDLQLAAQHFGEAPVEVSDVMHTPVETISLNEPLLEAARQMIEKRIGGLPVLDDNGEMVGILTETDLLRVLIDLLSRDTP